MTTRYRLKSLVTLSFYARTKSVKKNQSKISAEAEVAAPGRNSGEYRLVKNSLARGVPAFRT